MKNASPLSFSLAERQIQLLIWDDWTDGRNPKIWLYKCQKTGSFSDFSSSWQGRLLDISISQSTEAISNFYGNLDARSLSLPLAGDWGDEMPLFRLANELTI
jgi:hypothetical protein